MRIGRPFMAVLMTALAAWSLAACSGTASPKTQLLKSMHQLVPNVPDRAILTDAGTACTESKAKATHSLISDSMAQMEGVDGLDMGSANLRRYVSRLIHVAHTSGYC